MKFIGKNIKPLIYTTKKRVITDFNDGLLYKANGVTTDKNGRLVSSPDIESYYVPATNSFPLKLYGVKINGAELIFAYAQDKKIYVSADSGRNFTLLAPYGFKNTPSVFKIAGMGKEWVVFSADNGVFMTDGSEYKISDLPPFLYAEESNGILAVIPHSDKTSVFLSAPCDTEAGSGLNGYAVFKTDEELGGIYALNGDFYLFSKYGVYKITLSGDRKSYKMEKLPIYIDGFIEGTLKPFKNFAVFLTEVGIARFDGSKVSYCKQDCDIKSGTAVKFGNIYCLNNTEESSDVMYFYDTVKNFSYTQKGNIWTAVDSLDDGFSLKLALKGERIYRVKDRKANEGVFGFTDYSINERRLKRVLLEGKDAKLRIDGGSGVKECYGDNGINEKVRLNGRNFDISVIKTGEGFEVRKLAFIYEEVTE